MLNFALPLPPKVGPDEKVTEKWPSVLKLNREEKALATPLNTKIVPKWITEELSRRRSCGLSIGDEGGEKMENEENESFSSKEMESKKVPLKNFVHFSSLMSTYVCLTPNITEHDAALDKLGPDVSNIIRQCIAPLSLYGRILRDSGDDSLVIQFCLPDVALAPKKDLALIENALDTLHIPYVHEQNFAFTLPSQQLSGSNPNSTEPSTSVKESRTPPSGAAVNSCEGATRKVTGECSAQPPSGRNEKRESFAQRDCNEVSTVCFTLPVRCAVPLIQRILEKANLMNTVKEYALNGDMEKAIDLLSHFLDSSKSSGWRATRPREAASLLSFRAHLYFHMGAYKNAIKDARRAIEMDPTQVEGYSVATKSFISLGYPDLAEGIVIDCRRNIKFLPIRFLRGSLLCTLVGAFQRWRNSGGHSKIRLEVLPLSAAVRFSAYRYNMTHTSDEVSIAFSSSQERHAALSSYLTHPLKHPDHPGLTIENYSDIEMADLNGFPDSSPATATWINCVYSSTYRLLKSELLPFCSATMFFNSRSNRLHATRPFSPKSQLFEEKISLLLPVLGMGARIRIGGSNPVIIRPGDGIVFCNYCGGLLHVNPQLLQGGGNGAVSGGLSSSNLSCVVCSLGCGATYCSEECHDKAASEYHWIQCPRSILLNIGPSYGLEGNWTAASFFIRRVFLSLDYFINSLVPEVRLTRKSPGEVIEEKTDTLYAIAISLRIYKQIIALLLSFVLWPLLGVLPMSQRMEDMILIKSSKLELLLRELESKAFTTENPSDKYNLLLAEKILHALDIPFFADTNYSAPPTVAEELVLCPSLSLIPRMSQRDMKFSSEKPANPSEIPEEMKVTCAAAIWTFSQSIAGAIREFLLDSPLSMQRLLASGSQFSEDSLGNTRWTCYSFLSFIGSSRFISQLWDFCCSGYSIAEATFHSPVDSRNEELIRVANEFTIPVVVISPHLSIITDLSDFTGSCAYSRFCFEHEIQLRIVTKSPEESMMSVCSLTNDDSGHCDKDDMSLSSQTPIAAAYDPTPWIQWCSALAAGCTNIDTPKVCFRDVGGQHERYVSVTSNGPVKLDDMVRLKSLWCCA